MAVACEGRGENAPAFAMVGARVGAAEIASGNEPAIRPRADSQKGATRAWIGNRPSVRDRPLSMRSATEEQHCYSREKRTVSQFPRGVIHVVRNFQYRVPVQLITYT